MRAVVRFFREMHYSPKPWAVRTRWALLALDLVILLFFLVTTFVEYQKWIFWTDVTIGCFLILEVSGRALARSDRLGYLMRPLTIVDLTVIISLFLPAITEEFLFLRVLRTVRLLHSYQVLQELRKRSALFREHEQVIFSALNLFVFIFFVSALVYVLQVRSNPGVTNYIDALYFTIATLTTTGFGDITLVGSTGRLLAVLIMIVGVTLFLRLIQSIFRPVKVQHECPDCGLSRHDSDAVHCKHCGRMLDIQTEGVQ